ncbi:MAG TPA: TonB-dependent receptor, partial [Aquimonas sp.]|nr:TonB-dependent receptor [Aquimonas sp.]
RLPSIATTTGDADAFVAPGYGVLDLLFDTRLGEHASLNFGIFNLLDKKYWEWSATPNVVASSAVLDRYTAPGRYFSAQVDLHW